MVCLIPPESRFLKWALWHIYTPSHHDFSPLCSVVRTSLELCSVIGCWVQVPDVSLKQLEFRMFASIHDKRSRTVYPDPTDTPNRNQLQKMAQCAAASGDVNGDGKTKRKVAIITGITGQVTWRIVSTYTTRWYIRRVQLEIKSLSCLLTFILFQTRMAFFVLWETKGDVKQNDSFSHHSFLLEEKRCGE